MSANITGGEPVKPVIQLTDSDMEQIRALEGAGFGAGRGTLEALNRVTRGPRSQKRFEAARDAADQLANAMPGTRAHAAWQRNVAKFSNSLTSKDVHHDSAISSLSVQYANEEFIGEALMPAVLTPKRSDTFYTYNKRDRLAAPEDDSDRVADDGDISEIKDGRGEDSYSCVVRAKKNRIGATAVANQDAALNELMDLTESLMEQRALAREKRIATVMTTAGNYATANKTTLAGSAQWNDASGGDPIGIIQTAKAALWTGRGPGQTKAFSGLEVYNVLAQHPDILGLFLYGGSPIGLATPALIGKFFGLDDYLVGAARNDTANSGQAASYSRIWGDFFGVCRVMNRASLRNVAFGATMRWTMPGVRGANQGIVTGQWFEDNKGLGGTYFAKAGEAEHHKVVANDAGYLVSDCLA